MQVAHLLFFKKLPSFIFHWSLLRGILGLLTRKSMLFLRSKKHNKWFNAIWTIVGFLVIISMVALYMPAFF